MTDTKAELAGLIDELWASDDANALTNRAARKLTTLSARVEALEGALRGLAPSHRNPADMCWCGYSIDTTMKHSAACIAARAALSRAPQPAPDAVTEAAKLIRQHDALETRHQFHQANVFRKGAIMGFVRALASQDKEAQG